MNQSHNTRHQSRVAAALNRRRFIADIALKGLGVSVGLPLLDSVLASNALAAQSAATPPGVTAPVRMAFLYVPNGVNVDRWRGVGEGVDYAFGPTLEPLKPYKSDVQVMSGLAQSSGTGGPDGPGDHARATATILTGVRPRKTAGANIRAGISIDQLAAARIGKATRFSSLELSCDAVRKSGSCDSGYACAYSFNMSWRSANQPATPESNPRLVFERLFGAGTGSERATNLQVRQTQQRSILDFVTAEARRINGHLDAGDRQKLDEYLTGIREIEQRIIQLEKMGVPAVPELDLPQQAPADYREHIRLLADMLVLAFQTDSTRIATFMLAHDGSNRTFPDIGVGDGHHEISHHQKSADKLEKIGKIDHFYAEQLAYILGRLREIREGNGRSLLDNSMLVYASGLSDGNRHRHDDLPVVLAGSGGGQLATGRHLKLPEQPMTNLFLTMLEAIGAPTPQFGDSTAPLHALRS